MTESNPTFLLRQTPQYYQQPSNIHKEEIETSCQMKVLQLFLHKKMSRKNLERGKHGLYTGGEEQKKIRMFHRKEAGYKLLDVQSLSTTHRSSKESSEDHRVKVLAEKLQKLIFRKAFQIILKQYKKPSRSIYKNSQKGSYFLRKKLSQIDLNRLKSMSILAFPRLTEKIDDMNAHFMTKMQLLCRSKPIKQYQATIIFLLIRMEVRRRLSNLGFALQQLKKY